MAVGATANAKTTITIPPHPARRYTQPGGATVNRVLTATRSMIATALLSTGLIAATTLAAVPQAQASAQVFPRLAAFDWARTQAGKPYEYGGTGPNGYDCSGLVYAAYRHAGITLPRTTEEMLASSKLGRTNSPNPGELAFFGSGHVEFVTYVSHLTFGALRSGTVMGWHTWYPGSGWQPTVYLYVKGAH
jgi:cell wall-associated NlpC family hydrolase